MHQKNQLGSSLAAAFILILMATGLANAFPITYDFTVTATSGPLNGTVEHGTFGYDSSSIVPGGENSAAGLLTSLSFSWNGVAYDQAIANTGDLVFDASGNLILALFGTNCGSGCSVDAADNANEFYTFASPGLPNNFVYTVLGRTDAFFEGTTTAALAVPAPEPTTLALLGLGCALVGAVRRSRRNRARVMMLVR